MWKPDEVVPKHRRRAVALWVVLIVGIIVYSAFIWYKAVKSRQNPGTTFELSNIVYKYPDIWVCMYAKYGCDEWELEEECMLSASNQTAAVYSPNNMEYQQIFPGQGGLTTEDWCIVYETSKIKSFEGQERDRDNYFDYITLDMDWYPGGIENASKTCVAEDWEAHHEWMFIYLRDSETGSVSGVQVPYGCITNTTTSHPFTYVGVGVTKEEKLSGNVAVTFEAKTLSTGTQKFKADPDVEKPYAHLGLLIQQKRNSLLTIKEIDPLDPAELFGSVGGFWDLLLLLWPIFFVAASREAPHLKGRSFNKTIAKGVGGFREDEPVEELGPPRRPGFANGHRRRRSA